MITERNEKILWKESSHAVLHHFVSPPKDRERAGRFSPPFPLLRAILLDQSVTKRYKNVFHSWRAYNGDPGDPLGEREALHGSSRACVGGIRTPGGNVDSWNGHPRGGDPWHPTASISPLCHASNVQRCASKRRKKRERRKEEKPIDFSKIDKQFPWRKRGLLQGRWIVWASHRSANWWKSIENLQIGPNLRFFRGVKVICKTFAIYLH